MNTIHDGTQASAIFIAKVRKLRAEGFADDDFLTRQLVDDLYRETGTTYHLKQHLLFAMVQQVDAPYRES